MDRFEILEELKRRRGQLDAAIAALTGEHGAKRPYHRRRRRMSAAARAQISKMMKRRWAERKGLKKAA